MVDFVNNVLLQELEKLKKENKELFEELMELRRKSQVIYESYYQLQTLRMIYKYRFLSPDF